MHFPHLWHQPGFFKVTCAWSWRICGINPAIPVKRLMHPPDDTSSFPEDYNLAISFLFFLSKDGLLHSHCFPQVLKTMLRSTSRSSHALLSFGILRFSWFWCVPIFCLLKKHVYCDVTPGQVLSKFRRSEVSASWGTASPSSLVWLFDPKCGGTTLLRNVGVTSPNGVTSQRLWELQISHLASYFCILSSSVDDLCALLLYCQFTAS